MPTSRLPALSGALLALSFPGPPLPGLSALHHPLWAHVALLPLLLSLRPGEALHGLRQGWTTGAVFNLLCLYWVAYTQGGGPAVVAGTLLMAAYLGLFVAVWAAAVSLLMGGWGRRALAAAPFLWVAQEYALSLGELGFPWLLLGHGQVARPHSVQFAAFTGVYGVSFWVVLVDVLLFCGLRATGGRRLWLLAAAALCHLLPLAHGQRLVSGGEAGRKLRIALIQPNLSLGEKWGAGGLERSFAALAALSRQAAAQRPELIVWPETALPCYLARDTACRRRVRRLVDELDIPLLTGASDFDPASRQPYNAAFYLAPGQEEAMPSYAKMHLVPFGERTPYSDRVPLLRDIDWSRLTGDLGPAEFAPGTKRTLFPHPRAPFAVLICFESAFPDLVRRHVAAGARLLVNITNDSWFGRSAGPYQHALLNAMRAVENGVPIARCANGGQSLFIDRFGRRYQMSELFARTAIVGAVRPARASTFYSRHGDLFARACLLASALLFALYYLLEMRSRTPSTP